jgi:hypothetical protein
VLGTELSATNKIQAIGALAVSILGHGFGSIKWHKKNCKN